VLARLEKPTSSAVTTRSNSTPEERAAGGERSPIDVGEDGKLEAPFELGQCLGRVIKRRPIRPTRWDRGQPRHPAARSPITLTTMSQPGGLGWPRSGSIAVEARPGSERPHLHPQRSSRTGRFPRWSLSQPPSGEPTGSESARMGLQRTRTGPLSVSPVGPEGLGTRQPGAARTSRREPLVRAPGCAGMEDPAFSTSPRWNASSTA